MKCNNCNHIIPDDSKFCPDCGEKIMITPNLSISHFFPIWGITLNKTTWMDVEKNGYNVRREEGLLYISNGNQEFTCTYNPNTTIIDGLMLDGEFSVPNKWKNYGVPDNCVFSEWIHFFISKGFRYEVFTEPKLEDGIWYSNIIATSSDNSISLDIDLVWYDGDEEITYPHIHATIKHFL